MQCWCYYISSLSSWWWLRRTHLGIWQLKISILFSKFGTQTAWAPVRKIMTKKYHSLLNWKNYQTDQDAYKFPKKIKKIKTCLRALDGTGSCNKQVWIRKNAAISSQPWLNDREKSILLDEIQSSTPSALLRPHARQANQFAPDKRLLYRVCRVFQFLLCMLCTIWSFTGRKGGGGKKKCWRRRSDAED